MRTGHAARKLWRPALLGFLLAVPLAQFAVPAQAAQVGAQVAIATAPLFNAAISLVKPNLLFILDDSSSMDYNYLPDEVPWDIVKLANPDPQTDSHKVALTSSQCSGTAYNPTIAYSRPVDSNGNALTVDSNGNALTIPSVTAAPNDGYVAGSPTTDLRTQFYYLYTGTQPALAYTYSNSVVDTSTTFYMECNVTTVASPAPVTIGKFNKKVVNTTLAANQLNYANWWSYYRKRLLMMKTVAGKSFQTLDSSFRVGFSTLHDTQANESNTFLPIQDFASGTGSQKEKFYTKLYGISAAVSIEPQNFTPSRGALSKAGRLFAGKFVTGDGTAADQLRDPMQYSCQQNFALLASDGYWNSADDQGGASGSAQTNFGPFGLDNLTPVGNQDGAGTAPPMFEGNYPGGPAPNTLADVSMYYYQTDLRNPGNDFANPGCTSGATGANLCPKDNNNQYAPNVPTTLVDNNPKPHMTTLTVGLAINGLLGYSPTYQTDTSGDYFSIAHSNGIWPDPSTTAAFPYATTNKQVIERVDDLWHTAVNGRGTYFNANDPTTLVTALKGAIGGVAGRLGFTGGATSSLAPIANNNFLFVASYLTGQWTGNLVAESVDVSTGEVNTALQWCVETITGVCDGQLEGQALASSDTRTIYFNSPGPVPPAGLASFKYANLPAALQAYFNCCLATSTQFKLSQFPTWATLVPPITVTGDMLVDYLRGQSQYESQDGSTANLYRARKAKLGDIVDTQPVYLGKPFYQYSDPGYTTFKTNNAARAKTIFVSGNDGMLHAFNADTGAERWAFVPTAVMPNMYWLADASYAAKHHNYVNGRLAWSDVCFGTAVQCADAATADWHTILMGGLNGGGRGYYALDVTDPTNPKILWEFSASATDPNLGYGFGNPLAVKKSDGTWVVVVSSGYDNGTKDSDGSSYAVPGDGHGWLYVLNPKTGAVLARYTTGPGDAGTAAAPSGLARIAYWADNPEQNATALNAYGGDLAGNLWRFDINTGAVVKLATFIPDDISGNGGAAQPITTRPEMTTVGSDRMIFVATGKYLEAADLTNTKTQSLYALIDKGVSTNSTRTGVGALARRTLVDNLVTQTRTVTTDGNSPAGGWFLDFPDLGTGGGSERANVDMVLAVGTLVVPTNVPTDQICNASGFSWVNFLDFKTGEAVGGNPTTSVGTEFANDLTTGINAIWIGGSPEIIRTGNATGPQKVGGVTFAGVLAGVKGHRVGWREIFVPPK